MDRVRPIATFLAAPFAPDVLRPGARFAFLGIPQGVAYVGDREPSHAVGAPDAVRAAALVHAGDVSNYDFDVGGPLAHTATAITRLLMIAMGSTRRSPCQLRDVW